jgi:hypothetical protein
MRSGEEERKFLFLWCVTILSAIEVHRFYEMCQRSMNNPASCINIKKEVKQFIITCF